MNAERRYYIIGVMAVYTLTLLLGIFIKSAPEINYLAFAPGMFMIMHYRIFSRRHRAILDISVMLGTVLLYYPFGAISLKIMIASILWFGFVHAFSSPFAYAHRYLTEQDEEILRRKHRLEDMKDEAIKTAEQEGSVIDEEIKGITGLYSAVKELSVNLDLDNTAQAIREIIKKILKNFRVDLEQVQFALVLQKKDKKGEFFLSEQIGFDEDYIKQHETKLVKHIINGTKAGNIEYIADTSSASAAGSLNMVRSVLYVPFYAEEQLRGVMFISSGVPEIFSETQIENMKIIASQIAISLEKVYLYEEVQQMSITDSLTGLYVHRHFQEKLENELKRASRYEHSLSLVIGDIDYFKKINDTYGHLAGDYILKSIAITLKSNTKPIETVARYGGEEFVLIFPDCDKETAYNRAEKIRKDIAKQNFKFLNHDIKVTMSMGVASFPGDAISRRSLIDRADKMLYKAKEEGRNRVLKA